jgi:Xaa-Pro dipeptidase
MDNERISRLKKLMVEKGIDVLFCNLPENVLYISEYWPIIGASAVLFPVDGDPVLIMPFSELDYAIDSWVTDKRTFRFINMQAAASPTYQKIEILKDVFKEKGYEKAIVGYEGNFELVAGNNVAAEARVITPSNLQDYMAALPDVNWVDATDTIKSARIIKSQKEIEQLRITNEVASMGYETAREMIEAGVQESEIAGAVEGKIYGRGIGFKNVKLARGYCFVMSGINSANSWRPFCASSSKKLSWGEPVLVELDAMTNGYFNDLTRTYFVGKPDAKAKNIFDIVQEAVNTVIDAVKPGIAAAELDSIARKVIEKAGYGDNFPHQLGHGIGLQFHEPPTLHPMSDDIIEKGMVFAIEPAIYIPGFGGVRLEENIVVTDNGCINITPYQQRIDD